MLGARADVIWSGEENIDWNTGGYITLGSENFSTLNVADEIIFNITYVSGQTWPQVAFMDGSWSALPGAGNTSISSSTTSVSYYATTAMITKLQASGAVVSGCGFILNSIEIVASDSDEDMSAAVWIGNTAMGSDWGTYVTLPASCFTAAAEGDLLRFHYKDLGAGATLSIRDGSWNDMPDTDYVTPSGSYTKFDITEAMLTKLQAGGCIATGIGYTLTYVDVVDPASATTSLTGSVSVTNNWVYTGGVAAIDVKVTNGTSEAATANVELTITTDKYEAYTTDKQSVTVEAGKVATVSFEIPCDPGFYICTALVDGELARSFVFGVDPEEIVSAPDAQSDFEEFWANAKAELATVELNPTFTLLSNKTTSSRNVYQVEFYSIPDPAGGEPVAVRGYYCEPTGEGQYPLILHYQGYDSGTYDAWRPGGDDLPGYCELTVCTRGKLINNRDP